MIRRRSCAFLRVSLSLALAGLGGCALGHGSANGVTSIAESPALAVRSTGLVHGGQSPITGATIQLWAVGATGYGSAGSALIPPTITVTTSDGSGVMNGNANVGNNNNNLPAGNFTISGDYTCPVGDPEVYLTASGGNPGLTAGTNNTAILLMTALTDCNTLLANAATTFISVNEVTTVASIVSLDQFAGSSNGITVNVGSVSTTTAGIVNAFGNIANMVNITTGSALATSPQGNAVPQLLINTIADILVPCVNSAAANSSACTTLFGDVNTIGGNQPSNVLAAALSIVNGPFHNTSPLFNISIANAAFVPSLSSAPINWIVYEGGATTNCGGTSGPGYNVSGTVSYSGTKTGRIYLALGGGCGGGAQGVSLSAAGTYTIEGVPPGIYTLNAFMDTLGYGAVNVGDPSGSTSSVTVSTAYLGGQNVTLSDPGTITLSAPTLSLVSPFNTGAAAQIDASKSNGTESATQYTLQWSTTSSFTAIAGSQNFPAIGTHSNTWIVNGLTDGSVYYFRAYGTCAGTPVGPYSSTFGPVTIGAPSSGSAVSGSVTYTGTATGPMYVGLYNQYTSAVYAEYIANPANGQAYTVVVPNSSTAVYEAFAIIDQNNDGVVDAGDIQNVDNNDSGSPIPITAPTANVDITVPAGNSIAAVQTSNTLAGSPAYGINLDLSAGTKLPVMVTLESSFNADGANVAGPTNIALCGQSGTSCGSGFRASYSLPSASAPNVGDTYFFRVNYSDGTSETVSAAVTGVLSNFATSLAPTTGTSTMPTFTWIAPVCGACSNYTYIFEIGPTNGNSIWEVPGNANGLPYTTTSLAWGVDPTDAGNTPNPSSLTAGTEYSWKIEVTDSYGNQAITQANYKP